jgi:hypothetical protein
MVHRRLGDIYSAAVGSREHAPFTPAFVNTYIDGCPKTGSDLTPSRKVAP